MPIFKWNPALLRDDEAAIQVQFFARKWANIFWGEGPFDEKALRRAVEWEFYSTLASREQILRFMGKREAVIKQLGQMKRALEQQLATRIGIASYRRNRISEKTMVAGTYLTKAEGREFNEMGVRLSVWGGILSEAESIKDQFDAGVLDAQDAIKWMKGLANDPSMIGDPSFDPRYKYMFK